MSYLISDPDSRESLLIDPSDEIGAEYESFLTERDLRLKFIVETHTHADHVSYSNILKEHLGAVILAHPAHSSSAKDRGVADGEILQMGALTFRFIHTPGHTSDSISVVYNDKVFTGDTLLIGGTGRTDFQNGSPEELYESIWGKVLPLGESVEVHPGHNYKKKTVTTVMLEKQENPRLQMSRDEFITFMSAHHPPKPKLFEEAVSRNSR